MSREGGTAELYGKLFVHDEAGQDDKQIIQSALDAAYAEGLREAAKYVEDWRISHGREKRRLVDALYRLAGERLAQQGRGQDASGTR